ncbi:MAG: alpha/beta hydrolase, partial [Cyanobium sp.]
QPLPLAGAGLSLGGTILLNAQAAALQQGEPGLDALACISSPLDLQACTRQFERPRNILYQRWLVRRLRQLVLEDPAGLADAERRALSGPARPRSIRAFDALITAPRWGHASVDAYYAAASPLGWLTCAPELPPTLLLHASDDPWVPAGAAMGLNRSGALVEGLEVLLTRGGGHNGFHAPGDSPAGSWGDRLTGRWLRRRLRPEVEGPAERPGPCG